MASHIPRTSTPTRGPARTARACSRVPCDSNEGEDGAANQSNAATRRGNERHQLSDLNNRLATYIEKVNKLQNANCQLKQTLRRVEEKKTAETTSVKQSLHQQTDVLKTLLNDEAKLRATAQAEVKTLQRNIARVIKENDTLKQDLDRATHRINALETDNADLRNKYQTTQFQGLQKEKELEAARKQATEAENRAKASTIQNAALKKENESLIRINKFINETHEKQIEEIRATTESEIVEVSGRVEDQASSSLRAQIDEFRRINEVKLNEQRARFEKEKEQILSQRVPKQIYDQAKAEASSLAAEVADLKRQVIETKRLLMQERLRSTELARTKEKTIQEANEDYRKLKKEHDDLLGVNQSLEKELDVFRLLLEREESRLNLSGSGSSGNFSLSASPSSSSTSPNGSSGIASLSSPADTTSRKRKLSSEFESNESFENHSVETICDQFGPIRIADHDTKAGEFIVVENTSDEDQPLGRWRVVQQSGRRKAAHRFPPQFTIGAKEKITLWSANSGKKNNPPKDYVVDNIVFPRSDSGDMHLSTSIFNPQGKRIAQRITRLHSSTSGSSRKSKRVDDEDLLTDDELDIATLNLDESSCVLM